MLRPGEFLIGDHNSDQFQFHVDPQTAEVKAKGLVPRDYNTHPVGCYGAGKPFWAVSLPLIDRSEWSARIKDKIATKSQMSDLRMTGNAGQMVPSLDQDGKGFCWAHSSTSATMMLRAKMGLPYVGLSAYAIACIIKNYRDEGGWGAQSYDFIASRGVPSYQFWPAQSMSKANDKAETWANAALHKITSGFVDLQAAQYDRTLTFDQVGSLLLSDVPVVSDYNWWSHSVCAIDLTDGSTEKDTLRADSGKLATAQEADVMLGLSDPVTAGYGVRILNSWGDSWSDHGMGTLAGSKAVPDGAVAPLDTLPSSV